MPAPRPKRYIRATVLRVRIDHTCMKHVAAFFLSLSVCAANSQDLITLQDPGQTMIYNTTTVHVWGDNSSGQLGFPVTCVLNALTPKIINVKRYELAIPSGITLNSFCWGECYNADTTGDHPVWYAPSTVTMFHGTPTNGFDAYYDSQGQTNECAFRFVWFDDGNPTDSVWMDVVFHVTAVGVPEVVAPASALSIYPSPASDGPVHFAIGAQRPGQRLTLQLHDALGARVRSIAVVAGQKDVTIGAGELPAGAWFASLEADGRVVSTRRFVIAHH